jgi:hypothetical protein
MEDIDDVYNFEIEESDRKFLEALKAGGDKNELEKEYKAKLRAARDKYSKILKAELSKKPMKKKKASGKEKTEHFKVIGVDMKPSFKEKTRDKAEMALFKGKIGTRDFMQRLTPNFLVMGWMRMKKGMRRFFISLKEAFAYIFNKSVEGLEFLIKSIYSSLIWAVAKMKKGILAVFGWLASFKKYLPKKKKKEEKAGEKKEEVKNEESK